MIKPRKSLSHFEPEAWLETIKTRDDVLAAWSDWREARQEYGQAHGIEVSAHVEGCELDRELARRGL